MSRLPSLYSPYRFSPDSAFIVLRRMTVNGEVLQKGDPLPADSPLRKLPRRLETFLQQRYLSVVAQPVSLPPTPSAAPAEKVVQPEPAAKKVAEPKKSPVPAATRVSVKDLSQMTLVELQARAKLMGVSASGNKPELLARLKKVGN